jgi:hypothetical protein
MTGSRAAAGLAVVVVASLAVGCASDRPARTTHTTISGRFHEVGGPAPGIDQVVSGTISVYREATLTGSPVTSVHTDAQGRFNIDVEPGTYFLSGATPAVSGARCTGQGAVTAAIGAVATADVTCQLK